MAIRRMFGARTVLAVTALAAALSGCRAIDLGGPGASPPVSAAAPEPAGSIHVVRPGDTVYSLARRYGSTPVAIQAENRLDSAYTIRVGQALRIPAYRAPPPPSAARPLPPALARAPRLESPALGARQTDGPARPLTRPVRGEIVTPFGAALGSAKNDGVDIAAEPGAAVKAADDGEVAFIAPEDGPTGAVMLLQHPGGLVTIYGRIDNLTVAQGDRVRQGQKLGEVAEGGPGETPRLHFELRRGSEPIDPTPYL